MDQAAWIGNAVTQMSALAVTGSSPSFGRYCMAVAALPLLRCVWILAASCADWMRGPCWLTMALKYLHARMAALRVLGPSSVWFSAAVARMSRASSSSDRGGSVLAVLCAGLQPHILVPLLCLVGWRGWPMLDVLATHQRSKCPVAV